MKTKTRAILSALSAFAFLWPCFDLNRPAQDKHLINSPSTNTFTAEGKLRINEEPTDQSLVDSFIGMIISKGGEAITGGISVYAKTIALNLLKECGLDLRDATTKTLEKMQTQLNIIEKKIDAIAAKQEQYHSEDVLSKLLDEFVKVNSRYVNYVTGSLAYLGDIESDETISEEEAEIERRKVYDDGVKDLKIDGAPLATYVIELAKRVLQPNSVDQRKDVFYYYENTMGLYDKWSIQHYKNVKNFIAYLDSSLIILSYLAKFQMYYLAQDSGEGIKKTYELMMNDMADAVNAVNLSFANKLKELDWIRYDWDRYGMNKYFPTGKYYSIRLCTLTYNLEDRTKYSRQGLLLDYFSESTGKRGNWQIAFAYQPNQDVIKGVAEDFRTFSGEYCTSSYRIQDYLNAAGFWCKNTDLYNNSPGLFAGDLTVKDYGFLNDDHDYQFTYYDVYGNYQRGTAYTVATYHTWWTGIDYTEIHGNDQNYYICFTTVSNYKCYLDGAYKQTYMNDVKHTVNERLYWRYGYMTMYQKVGPIDVHDSW